MEKLMNPTASTALVLASDGGGSVDPFGCPICQEYRADYLEIDDDSIVQCLTCGTLYGLPVTNAAVRS